jgi:hypothetical protein
MIRHHCSLLVTAMAVFVALPVARAGTFFPSLNSYDTVIGSSFSIGGGPDLTGYYVNDPDSRIGSVNAAALVRQEKIYGFSLPVLDLPKIAFATLYLSAAEKNDPDQPFNLDLYGLHTTNPDVTGISLFYQGDNDPTQAKLADDFVIGGGFGPTGSHVADVTTFVKSLYAGTSPTQSEVFFRLNPNLDFVVSPPNVNEYITADFLQSGTLIIDTIPEPETFMLALAGAFFAAVPLVRRGGTKAPWHC